MTEPLTSESPSSVAASSESTGRAWRLARKELREILRDRRTVITLILMPLLVYPLLGSVMSKGVLSTLSDTKVHLHVSLENVTQAKQFLAAMARGERILASQKPGEPAVSDSTESTNQEPATLTFPTEPNVTIKIFVPNIQDEDPLEKQVADGRADLGVRVAPLEPELLTAGRFPRLFLNWQLLQRRDSALSKRAAEIVQQRLEAANKRYLERLVEVGSLPPVNPERMETQLVAPETQRSSPLVTFIPLVLVLMTMTGAVYPSIDLTAGERERGTMEILVAAPISRMTLLAGKFVAVLTVALLTATMNLISMFATLFALGLEGTVLGTLNLTMVIQVAVMMIVFAAFFSAVLLSITSVARSFKEAQAYLIPLMLVSLSPGIFALLPDIEMNSLMAVTPLVNTVLMGRDLLHGDVNILMFAIVLISTALYGVLALSVAARIFGSDAVLYGSSGTWSDLFRRPQEPLNTAPISISLSCLAVLFSLFIVVGSLPSRLQSSLYQQLLMNAAVLLLLFVAVPLAFAAASRVRLNSGFAFFIPPRTAWIAATLLGISLWPFLYEMQVYVMTEDRIEFLKSLFEGFELNLKAVPFWVKLLSLAIAPAVCEEFFFRGFLQNSIRSRSSAALAILASGVLFGLFHVIVRDALLFERLLPSTLMGIVLGFVFEKSGSVLPGMVLHVIHNGLLITIAEYEDQLSALGERFAELKFMSQHQHLPELWLATAAVPIVCALAILLRLPAQKNSR